MLQGISLSQENRLEFERAQSFALKVGKPPDVMAREYHDLSKRLGPGRTLEEAVAFLLLHGKRTPVDRNVPAVVEELPASLTTLKRSTRYIEDMRSRLRRFAEDSDILKSGEMG